MWGAVVRAWADDREVVGSNPSGSASKLGQVHCLCLFDETLLLSRWSVPSGVYARGSKISNTRGYICNLSLTPNSEIHHFCVSPRMSCLNEYI